VARVNLAKQSVDIGEVGVLHMQEKGAFWDSMTMERSPGDIEPDGRLWVESQVRPSKKFENRIQPLPILVDESGHMQP